MDPLHDLELRLDGVDEVVDVVAFDGGDALDLFEVVDGVADVLAFGNADGDAGDDAVVVNKFGAIRLDGLQQRLLADFLIIHDNQRVRADVDFFLDRKGIVDDGDGLLRPAGNGRREGREKEGYLFHALILAKIVPRYPSASLPRA